MAIIDAAQPSQHSDEHPGANAIARLQAPPRLRRRLIVLDFAAVASSWSFAYAVGADTRSSGAVVVTLSVVVAATMAALRGEHLYRSRVAAIRSEELARIARVSCVSAVVAGLGGHVAGVRIGPVLAVTTASCMFLLLAYGRGRFQAWITDQRSHGQFGRPVVVIGNSQEASFLIELFHDSPELGFMPVGFAGPLDPGTPVPNVPWLGEAADVVSEVTKSGASGVVISTSWMSSAALNLLVRDLHAAGVHVHLSSGITGMHHRRLRVQPVGHEPLIYVEPLALSRSQLFAKRTLDVIGACLGLIVFSPLLIAAAIAIKLGDGGAVLFRQERVGRDGQPFTILKLRTMCVDAEARLHELLARNERQGPLFKLEDDPRVTGVGRFLRASSIDELPQLLNVIAGTMSLAGPRPALRHEVEAFDGKLIGRLSVKPGVTGLWQVEARDKASFEAYRKLDLFYVENWSVWLDIAILLKTGRAVLRRLHASTSRAHHPTSLTSQAMPQLGVGASSMGPTPATEAAE